MYGYVTDYFYAQESFLIALHFRAFLIVQRQKIKKNLLNTHLFIRLAKTDHSRRFT